MMFMFSKINFCFHGFSVILLLFFDAYVLHLSILVLICSPLAQRTEREANILPPFIPSAFVRLQDTQLLISPPTLFYLGFLWL